jgi:phosphoglycolate phosphatase
VNNQIPIRTVLFDLDGTLADTAPDLAYALNCVLEEQGQEALPFEKIRPGPVVSHGGIALIKLGFGIEQEHPDFELLRQRLLDIYRENITRETELFPGMQDLLCAIEGEDMNWGVVTNKPGWLTEPLMESLSLTERAACIISGDTCENRKPHPEPILHGCHLAGSDVEQCLYVGDAERDIEAGRHAGVRTAVALFGYIGENDNPQNWQADVLLESPDELQEWITSFLDD